MCVAHINIWNLIVCLISSSINCNRCQLFEFSLSTLFPLQLKHEKKPDMINILMQVRKYTMETDGQLKDADEGFATDQESEIEKTSVTRK